MRYYWKAHNRDKKRKITKKKTNIAKEDQDEIHILNDIGKMDFNQLLPEKKKKKRYKPTAIINEINKDSCMWPRHRRSFDVRALPKSSGIEFLKKLCRKKKKLSH